MPIDAVLFDVDDTLCRYRRSGTDVLELAFADAGVEPFFDATEYHRRYGEFLGETGGIDDLRRECFAAIADEAGREPDVGYAVAAAFAAERDHRDVDPLPGALEAVECLGAHHGIGVVTNGDPAMQSRKLAGLGLADAFDVVVHGGYDAAAKPDSEPFERALSRLDVPPDRAVHVGNSLWSDVRGRTTRESRRPGSTRTRRPTRPRTTLSSQCTTSRRHPGSPAGTPDWFRPGS